MKKMMWIVGVILLAALAGGGGFWAGMQYQISQANQVQQNFLQARGQGEGQMPGAGQFPGDFQGQMPGDRQAGGMGGFGGGVSGQVKSLEGNVLTLSTAEEVTTVTLSETTRVVMTVEGTVSDLAAGVRVVVTGERDSDGNLLAAQVQILNSDPAATRTAP